MQIFKTASIIRVWIFKLACCLTMACETKADETIYEEAVNTAKRQIKLWANNYYLNRWENQPIYPEVLIEKKALEGVFYKTCMTNSVALGACKGYPS